MLPLFSNLLPHFSNLLPLFSNLLPLSGRPHKSPGAPTLARGGKSRRGQGAKVLIQQNIGKQGRNLVTEGRVGKRF